MSGRITDEMLIAYLRGDLPPSERKVVEQAVADDPAVAERLRGHRVIGRLKRGARASDDPAKAARTGDAPVVSLDAARARRNTPEPKPKLKLDRPRIDPRRLAIVAALLAGIAIGLFMPRFQSAPMDGHMRALGPLKAVLETRLSATQPADARSRVGPTFRDRNGVWCRGFSSETLSGVACREGGGWQVRMAQNGPASAGMTAAIAAMNPGAPADAAAEKKARASGWR